MDAAERGSEAALLRSVTDVPERFIPGHETADGYIFASFHPRINEDLKRMAELETRSRGIDSLEFVKSAIEKHADKALEAGLMELRGEES
jgi:hypothetical protein